MTQPAITAPPNGVSATTASTHDKAVGEESLAPQQTRIMDPWSYLLSLIHI